MIHQVHAGELDSIIYNDDGYFITDVMSPLEALLTKTTAEAVDLDGLLLTTASLQAQLYKRIPIDALLWCIILDKMGVRFLYRFDAMQLHGNWCYHQIYWCIYRLQSAFHNKCNRL